MRSCTNILVIGAFLLATTPLANAQAARTDKPTARAQTPVQGQSCKPKWPYIVLTCVA